MCPNFSSDIFHLLKSLIFQIQRFIKKLMQFSGLKEENQLVIEISNWKASHFPNWFSHTSLIGFLHNPELWLTSKIYPQKSSLLQKYSRAEWKRKRPDVDKYLTKKLLIMAWQTSFLTPSIWDICGFSRMFWCQNFWSNLHVELKSYVGHTF